MQRIEEILKIINEKNLNVSEISRKTGIPGTRIYKWLDGKGKPKTDDAEKLKAWAREQSELVPNSNDPAATAAPLRQPREENEPTPMQILDRLSKAFIDQAEGFKAQAEAFKAQADLLRSIESKMARQESQAKMQDVISEMNTTLENLWNGLIVVSARQAADRDRALPALSLLSGRPENQLLTEANKMAAEIFEANGAQDKLTARGR